MTNLVGYMGHLPPPWPSLSFASKTAHRPAQVGELIDAIVTKVETATSDQSRSEGATDTDVPAKEGQAEERAWELFTG